jgi:hypothetical protein
MQRADFEDADGRDTDDVTRLRAFDQQAGPPANPAEIAFENPDPDVRVEQQQPQA